MSLLPFAIGVAKEAGALLLPRFRGPAQGLGSKSSGTDMVSDADRDAEAVIVAAIRAARPDDSILGEEGAASEGSSGMRWIIDPLDGTTNFLYGQPQWCVSIACDDADGTMIGVVHDPVRGETFACERGSGATLNGKPIHVTGTESLAHALVATGFSYAANEREAQGTVVARVLPEVRDIRRYGAAALDLAWVACGRFDAYYETPMNIWDIAAGLLLVREAGGSTDDLPSGGAVASTPGIFHALSALVTPD